MINPFIPLVYAPDGGQCGEVSGSLSHMLYYEKDLISVRTKRTVAVA